MRASGMRKIVWKVIVEAAVAVWIIAAIGCDRSGRAPEEMVAVPAGSFWMGCVPGDDTCQTDERPRHRVAMDAFYLDAGEVTASACCAGGVGTAMRG